MRNTRQNLQTKFLPCIYNVQFDFLYNFIQMYNIFVQLYFLFLVQCTKCNVINIVTLLIIIGNKEDAFIYIVFWNPKPCRWAWQRTPEARRMTELWCRCRVTGHLQSQTWGPWMNRKPPPQSCSQSGSHSRCLA